MLLMIEPMSRGPPITSHQDLVARSDHQARSSGMPSALLCLLKGADPKRGARMDFFSILIGRRLANREGKGRKISAIEGVPAMGLDGLGSSAYGPEAALAILIPVGAAGVHLIVPI